MIEEGQVLDTNDAFYRLMRRGDYEGMTAFWSRKRRISCMHPGGTLLIGREAVMQSWRPILGGEPPPIWPEDSRALVTGSTAFVLGIERIGRTMLMATNAYVLEDGHWRMINHQAAHMPAIRAR